MRYLDVMLSAFDSSPPKVFAGGPWSNRQTSGPDYLATFVEPELVCEVEYLEITKGTGKMRGPSFKGMRPDKSPDECVLERPAGR